MSDAHIKKVFPGAVTSQGFFSFYQYVIEPDANRIFILKGGPGVGKSSFMKKIAETMLERGYDVEYHCCSSDNDSIDGIVIPELKIGLLDGTSPHIVDPKNPGAVDEIINLGQFWNEDLLTKSRDEIARLSAKASSYYPLAYFALQEAKIAMDEWRHYVSKYQDWRYIDQLTLNYQDKLLKAKGKAQRKERHLFAWGHTPQGKTQHIDTLLHTTKRLYILEGHPGTGKSKFLSKIADRASMYDLDIEYYHNTLDPERLDLIILPELEIAFVINCEPYEYKPKFEGEIEFIDFEMRIDMDRLMQNYCDDILDCQFRVNQHIARARKHSASAKATHDLLEGYYVPAMDFNGVENELRRVQEKILSYI